MPNLKDIRRRIDSVEKTQQITRAMRMVAGAKLRRAQEAIESARPYADRMTATLAEVAAAMGDAEHPLLEERETVRNSEIIVVTSDRGLCGAFNANVFKHAEAVIEQRLADGIGVTITTAGKKISDYYKRHRKKLLGGDYPQEGWVQFGQAVEIAERISQRYQAGEIDEVVLVYSEFKTTMTQTPRDVRLLPVVHEKSEAGEEAEEQPLPYEIEPNAEVLLRTLVPRAVEVEIYRVLLENQAGEHAARMTAMEAATRNSEELVETLTLQFNRARQATITNELVEIVSGAGAL